MKDRKSLNKSISRPGKGKILILMALALIFAAAAAFGLSADLSDRLPDEKGSTDLFDFYEGASGAEFEDGSYRVTEDDPYLEFRGINGTYGGVFLRAKGTSASGADIPVSIYWTRSEGEPFVGALSASGFLKKGRSGVCLDLPDYPIHALRLDIDGDLIETGADLFTPNTVLKRTYGADFFRSFLIKGLLCFLIFFSAFIRFSLRPAREILTGKDRSSYNAGIDLVRILATVFVVASHLLNDTLMPTVQRGDQGYAFFRLIPSFTLCCNVLYVMISGASLLSPSEESIGTFYKKRLGRVLIPMIAYYAFYMLLGYPEEVFREGIGPGLRAIIGGLFAGRSSYVPHFWLIYVLLGLYVIAPFLRLLVSRLSEAQLALLVLLIFAANVFLTYLPVFGFYFGPEIAFSAWTGVFLLGYYLGTEHAKKLRIPLLIFGGSGILFSFLTLYFRPDLLETAATSAPLMWMSGMFFYLLLMRVGEFLRDRAVNGTAGSADAGKEYYGNPFIRSFAKYSYGMLLIHMYFMTKLILPCGWRYEAEHGHLKICMLLMLIAALLISYLFALIFDNAVETWRRRRT
ncbi:MAG: acyltransferase [Lachnospiraceae bacterium]|nr:acyltransferase [Lachnospiraceae bacterium]